MAQQDSNIHTLANPPIIKYLFQLLLDKNVFGEIDDIASKLKKDFPKTKKLFHSNVEFEKEPELGKSKITAQADTKRKGYVLYSEDQKQQVEFYDNRITFESERVYKDWTTFKQEIFKIIDGCSDILTNISITHISIRFINKFTFNSFADPLDYFNTTISASNETEVPYPILNFSHTIKYIIPNTDIVSIVSQTVDPVSNDIIYYYFDIDTVNKENIIFDIDTIENRLDTLHDIRNKIFFDNITKKTIDLCN